jgi:catechol 2,3-dioxygenase-like lactoylglutathione lyase family enzyme
MIDFSRSYHVGVRVQNLQTAMLEMGADLSLTWCEVQVRKQTCWTPETGLTTHDLRFTYSAEGPQHVELLQGAPGSVWHAGDHPGIHHVGIWVDDVAAETNEVLAKGWKLAAASKAPEDGYGSFTYVVPPSGLIVELVDAAVRPRFERWFAGGPLA